MMSLKNFASAQSVVLYFDVNKTILMEDKASGKTEDQVILGMLAENYEPFFVDWTGEGKKESYYQYITKVLKKGYKGQSFKKQRNHAIKSKFLPALNKLDPVLFAEAEQLRLKLQSLLRNSSQHHGLVDAFVKFLKAWDLWCGQSPNACKLVIRTFGHDIDQVLEGIKKITGRDLRVARAHITVEGDLSVSTKEVHPLSNMQLYIVQSSSDYHFIQDNYGHWKAGSFQSQHGKPFPLSEDTLSLFFDDNVEGAERGDQKDIVHPFDESGQFVAPAQLIKEGVLIPVSPLQVCLDEDYFIKKIRPYLAGF